MDSWTQEFSLLNHKKIKSGKKGMKPNKVESYYIFNSKSREDLAHIYGIQNTVELLEYNDIFGPRYKMYKVFGKGAD